MNRELVIASRNAGKIAEIRQIFADLPLTLRSIADVPGAPDVEETGTTFSENARLKAVAAARHAGQAALADDSGLEVDALGGRPGVYSARYAGPAATDADNNAKLLRELADVPDAKRTARYQAVIVLAVPDGSIVAEAAGACEGVIGREGRGTAGFGYDPLFLLPAHGRTMAELGLEIKNRISHRAVALARLREEMIRLKWPR